ncbi:MAG TPA: fused MFS/spermidine synthase [Verrucomicrobiae bacterium]|nr:fused MFS/spermidine synthase [Verrucomicrobiae bacterium]
MLKVVTGTFVFCGGFAVMVLEIIGTRFLAKEFGGSFYVWVSQIGVVLIALATGYAIGGALADRFRRARVLALPLALAGLFTMFIPGITEPLLEKIVMRHPAGQDIPMLWLKLDPVLGSAVVFFLPCFVLAILPPYMVRIAARRLDRVGSVSGFIYAASTVGSIAGVFVSGYIFIDCLTVPQIFQATGILTLALAALSLGLDSWLGTNSGSPPALSKTTSKQ